MFGKKIPNPIIKIIEDMFGDRIIPINYAHSESFVSFAPEEFVKLAKMTRSAIFKEDERPYYLKRYSIFGPDGVMYFTEVEQKVKEK